MEKIIVIVLSLIFSKLHNFKVFQQLLLIKIFLVYCNFKDTININVIKPNRPKMNRGYFKINLLWSDYVHFFSKKCNHLQQIKKNGRSSKGFMS